MRRITVILMVALMVASVAVVPMSGLAATTDHVVTEEQDGESAANETSDNETVDNETSDNETEDGNASVAPGQRLSGIVGVQEAELEGEVDRRAFGLQVARAATNTTKAEVVKEQVRDMQERIHELKENKQELNESLENDSMSEGRYAAEVAELAARTETVEQLANESENVTRGMPTDLLESNGVNATAIQMLKENASELAGPQVAQIARTIGGPDVTPGGPPEGVPAGPPADRPGENESSDRGPGEAGPPSDRPGQDGGPPADRPGENESSDRGPGQAGPPSDRPGQADDRQNDTASPTPTPADGENATEQDDDGDAGENASDGANNQSSQDQSDQRQDNQDQSDEGQNGQGQGQGQNGQGQSQGQSDAAGPAEDG
jgi:hypothetical protein